MVNQEHYYCSFYVNRANRSKYASNNIGMYFSDTPIHVTNSNTLPFTAQINDTSIVTDTVNWTEIYGEYVAHGGESYLIIGSFVPNALCDTLQIGVGGGYAYYYIDEVNVHCCTCDSTTSLHAGVGEVKEDEGIEIYPNPTSTKFTITSTIRIESIKLYNIVGELIGNYELGIRNGSTTIDISNVSKGIYFAEIKTEKGIQRKKFIKQ